MARLERFKTLKVVSLETSDDGEDKPMTDTPIKSNLVRPGDERMERPLEMTAALNEEDRKNAMAQATAREEKIQRMMVAIDEVLHKEECVWQEWLEVINRFNKRDTMVMGNLTINEIKERYDNARTGTR